MRRRTLVTRFHSLGFGVTETVWELVASAFYVSKGTFDDVPIPVAFILESCLTVRFYFYRVSSPPS